MIAPAAVWIHAIPLPGWLHDSLYNRDSRFPQRIGLIEEPARPLQGFRNYPVSVIDGIHFIKRTQEFEFSLSDVAELLSLGD
ncbi:MAG TPA: hypothetical protein ENG92_00360 [Thiolapillus brandeum]|uniref:HTH merR-type domain-containing protein n=1 Tax=Thiolapillus brandeum TaxID=1076588 RepID=A0A831K1Q0_9GAMM|nr:hypothetical protein [Thiolapillus brandeum]